MINRHPRYNQNIVDNFRRSVQIDSIVSDDLIYWAYEMWALSEDYPDESLLREWLDLGLEEAEKHRLKYTREESVENWRKWRESH